MDTHTSDRWAFRPVGPEIGYALTDAWESFPEAPVEALAIFSDRFCAVGPSTLVFGCTADLQEFDSSKFIHIDIESPRQVSALSSCQFVVVTDASVFVYSQAGEIQWRYDAHNIQSLHTHPIEANFAFCNAQGKGYMVIEGEVMEMDATHLLWDHTGDIAAMINHKDIILGNQSTGEQNEYKVEDEVVYANFINQTLFIATVNDKLFVLQEKTLVEVPELCPAFGDETRQFSWYFSDLSGWQKANVAACAYSKSTDIGLISAKSVIEPMEDDARAVMPLDEESFKDTSPVGASVDWTSKAKISLFGETDDTAPIFWVLNNLGNLIGWAIASKDAIDEKANLRVPVRSKEFKFDDEYAKKGAQKDTKEPKEVKSAEGASTDSKISAQKELKTEPKVESEATKQEPKGEPKKELEKSTPEVFSSSPIASRWATSESTPHKQANSLGNNDAKPDLANTYLDSSSRPTSGGVSNDVGPRFSFGKSKQKADASQSTLLSDQSASFFGFASEDKKPDEKRPEGESHDYSSMSLADRFGSPSSKQRDDPSEGSDSGQSYEGDYEEGSNLSQQEFGDESDTSDTDEQQNASLSQQEYGSESGTEQSDSESDLGSGAQRQVNDEDSVEESNEQVSSDGSYERIDTPVAPRLAPIKPSADGRPANVVENDKEKLPATQDTDTKQEKPMFKSSAFADFAKKDSAFGSGFGTQGAFSSFGSLSSGSTSALPAFGTGATSAFKPAASPAFDSFRSDTSKVQTQPSGFAKETSDIASARGEEPIVTDPNDDEFRETGFKEPEVQPDVTSETYFDNINSTDCQEPTDLLPFAPEEYWDLGTLDQVYAETNSFFQVIDNNIQVLQSHLGEQEEVPGGSDLMAFDQWTLAKSAALTPILDEQLTKSKGNQRPDKSQLLSVIEQLDQLLNDTRQLGQSVQAGNSKKTTFEHMQMPYGSKQYQYNLRTKIGQCRKLLQSTEEKLMLLRVQCGERPANVDLIMACKLLEHQITRTNEQYPEIFNSPWDLTSLELGIANDRFDRQKFMEGVDKSKRVKNLARLLQERVITASSGEKVR